MKLFKGKRMKILIIVSLILQLTTTLWADMSYTQYISMKDRAYTLYENGDKRAAFSSVKEFLKSHPQNIRAHNLLAVLYYWSGDLAQSKVILQNILKYEKFPQAVALLKKIEKKEGKSLKVASAKVPLKKLSKNPVADSDNLLALVSNIKKDPNDALSRKILALHYEKIGNSKQSTYFANSVLNIDPDDMEMLALLKSKNITPDHSKERSVKAFRKLEDFYNGREYDRFMNLYSSLENSNVLMPTHMHVNALYCAIELGKYKKAKSILHIYRMPKNKNIAQIEELIDEKLLLNRFAKDCSTGLCKPTR